MNERKKLTARQRAVMEELITGELDRPQILRKHRIKAETLERWLAEPHFRAELDRRIEWLCRRSDLIIARYKSVAAARLIELTNCDNYETARKACLDIINLARPADSPAGPVAEQAGAEQAEEPISAETAARLLAALADEEQKPAESS